ncbi:lasso peptide biosynthesis B2 protein [Sinosporangium siamense]|uniref:Microcin J25-processing protein McjB C-terminal domain-containing protein n=1 Tax=Sinosporangium siamense TaxID=1367973 RepID=A0A919VA50_9ACTN|nr:lasso peptide biosynthesis B2 protein [Sinosporangium siamense]GII95027.1 hypothetical protein Ssi02_52580 [Sinosporangium siamense]
MSVHMSLEGNDRFVGGRRKVRWPWLARVVVLIVARVLALLPPRHMAAVLTFISRGAKPATLAQTRLMRDTVCAVSPRAAGIYGCLMRSIGTALMCRIFGVWPTWCVGVRTEPPFEAHAWVEAEGQLVNEPGTRDCYRRLITVRPYGESLVSEGTTR